MTKRTYKSESQAQAARDKAVRFARDALDDPDKAEAIEDESLNEWLTRSGRRVKNKFSERRQVMPRKTAPEYAAEIRALKDERDQLASENDELNSLLDEISDLTTSDSDDEEDEDDDFEE